MASMEPNPVMLTQMNITGRRMPDQVGVSGMASDRVGSKPTQYDLDIDSTPGIVAALTVGAIIGLVALKVVGFRFVFGVTGGAR